MIQATQQQSDIYKALSNTAMSEYFRCAGDLLAEESALLGSAISNILASEGHVTNKAIILWLVNALECTDDVVTADVIRKTLEIVVGYTMDDI
ncbi:biofilm/acid-resistance regulator YmgB/AriR [Dryocola sp. LX212]